MTANIRNEVLSGFARVEDDRWGQRGYLNAGDTVISEQGYRSLVTEYDLRSYENLDSFLESRLGVKIDFIPYNGSSLSRGAEYLAYRSQTRGLGVVYIPRAREVIPLQPGSYRAPDNGSYASQYTVRVGLCLFSSDLYCYDNVNRDYQTLLSSAGIYTNAYRDFYSAYQNFLHAGMYPTLNRQHIAELVRKSNQYLQAKFNFESDESLFYSRTYFPDYHVPRSPGGGSPDDGWDSDWDEDWDTAPPTRRRPQTPGGGNPDDGYDEPTTPPRRTPMPPRRSPGGGSPDDGWDGNTTPPPPQVPGGGDPDDGWN